MTKVAINGMGRIGRAAFKIILESPHLRLTALNDLMETDQIAYLLNHDSVYGRYEKRVEHDESKLMVGGESYPVYGEKDPSRLPWANLEIDVVFECTGIFRKKEGLQKHLQAGARYAILSAPAKSDDIPMVVHGVNGPEGDQKIISCASCTTNCIAPVVEIMGRRIGIHKAVMTTVHAYTSSQTIVDGPRKKWRRGRAAAVNFVPTTTGAAVATTKVLPQFRDKFDGVAVRGPVPVGSIADMVFSTIRETSVDEVNDAFKTEAISDRYRDTLGVSEEPIVSSDIIRDPRASVVDLTMTQVVDGDLVKVMSWYDNEWGYANQMIRTAVEWVSS
jgi:glyceraldehyde 3-phosphate dehydrogenase